MKRAFTGAQLRDAATAVGLFLVLVGFIALLVFGGLNAMGENSADTTYLHTTPLLAVLSGVVAGLGLVFSLGGKNTWLRVACTSASAVLLVIGLLAWTW